MLLLTRTNDSLDTVLEIWNKNCLQPDIQLLVHNERLGYINTVLKVVKSTYITNLNLLITKGTCTWLYQLKRSKKYS